MVVSEPFYGFKRKMIFTRLLGDVLIGGLISYLVMFRVRGVDVEVFVFRRSTEVNRDARG